MNYSDFSDMSNMLDFIASIVDSLAWPGLVAYFLYLFKDSVKALLKRLSHLKYKDLEADFRESLEQIKQIEASTNIKFETHATLTKNETVSLLDLANNSPRAAIIESWIRVERATDNFLKSCGITTFRSYQGLRKLPQKHLSKIEHILTPYQELRMLKNKAAHASDYELTADIAEKYIEMAAGVENEIINATK